MTKNNKKQELITVGITSYNAVDTIRGAVNSALKQTWEALEIIVVDDASSDGTLRILEELSRIHDNIKIYVNDKNSGVAVSRNKIIQEAKGIFIAFFDDDDVSLSNRIAEQYKRICEYEQHFANDKIVVCHTARLQIYPDGSERAVNTMGEDVGEIAPNGIAVARRILTGKSLKYAYGACPTCSQMARLTVYEKLNGFDESFRRGEDTDFNIRLAESGGHFVGIAIPLVKQFMTKTTDKNLDEELRNTILLLNKHKLLIDKYDDFGFCCAWINLKYNFLKHHFFSFFFLLFKLFFFHPIKTLKRIIVAIPNIKINRAMSRFYLNSKSN
jgi:glycosyltransferase involved in cell wall biosynthesis